MSVGSPLSAINKRPPERQRSHRPTIRGGEKGEKSKKRDSRIISGRRRPYILTPRRQIVALALPGRRAKKLHRKQKEGERRNRASRPKPALKSCAADSTEHVGTLQSADHDLEREIRAAQLEKEGHLGRGSLNLPGNGAYYQCRRYASRDRRPDRGNKHLLYQRIHQGGRATKKEKGGGLHTGVSVQSRNAPQGSLWKLRSPTGPTRRGRK